MTTISWIILVVAVAEFAVICLLLNVIHYLDVRYVDWRKRFGL